MAKGQDVYEGLLQELTFGRKYNRKRVKDAITLSLVQIKLWQVASEALRDDNKELQKEIDRRLAGGSTTGSLDVIGLGEEIESNRKLIKSFKKRIMAMEIEIEEQGLLRRKK